MGGCWVLRLHRIGQIYISFHLKVPKLLLVGHVVDYLITPFIGVELFNFAYILVISFIFCACFIVNIHSSKSQSWPHVNCSTGLSISLPSLSGHFLVDSTC